MRIDTQGFKNLKFSKFTVFQYFCLYLAYKERSIPSVEQNFCVPGIYKGYSSNVTVKNKSFCGYIKIRVHRVKKHYFLTIKYGLT